MTYAYVSAQGLSHRLIKARPQVYNFLEEHAPECWENQKYKRGEGGDRGGPGRTGEFEGGRRHDRRRMNEEGNGKGGEAGRGCCGCHASMTLISPCIHAPHAISHGMCRYTRRGCMRSMRCMQNTVFMRPCSDTCRTEECHADHIFLTKWHSMTRWF